MKTRQKGCTGCYRYGFNGQEKEQNGEYGSIAHLAFSSRVYNPAIGKFLSVDPLAAQLSWQSPYSFAENSPIAMKELEGEEGIPGMLFGAATEYLSQGAANIISYGAQGNSIDLHALKKAFIDDIDLFDVAASGAQGFFWPSGTGKILKKGANIVLGEGLKGKFNVGFKDKKLQGEINENGRALVEATIGVAGSIGGDILTKSLYKNSRKTTLKRAERHFKKAQAKATEKISKGTTAKATVWTSDIVDKAQKSLSRKERLNNVMGSYSEDQIGKPVGATTGITGEMVEKFIFKSEEKIIIQDDKGKRTFRNEKIDGKFTGEFKMVKNEEN